MGKLKKHKISSQPAYKEEKKPMFSKQKIWTIILGGLMILSVFGIMLGSESNVQDRKEYNGHKFEQRIQGNQYVWQTEIDKKTYTFDYYPGDLEEFNFTADVAAAIKGIKTAYITFDPNVKKIEQFELARFKLLETAAKEYGIYLMNGITAQNPAYSQPIVDCANATQYVPVIKLVQANGTNSFLDGNCLVIEANEYSILGVKDKILYTILGIV